MDTYRIAAIDRFRGLCIVSMVLGHFAPETVVSKIIHLPLWVDGAMGFVMISGIVVGIVRRRHLKKGASTLTVAYASWRRAAQLWVIFCSVIFATLAVGSLVDSQRMTPTADQLGGWAAVLVDTLAMQASLRYIDLLTFYVAILLVSPFFVWCLRRRRGAALALAVSATIYLLDVAYPVEALRSYWFADDGGVLRSGLVLVVGRWQLLFIIGLVLGWEWDRVSVFLSKPRMRRSLLGMSAMVVLAARIGDRLFESSSISWFHDKTYLAPGTLVFSVLLVLAMIHVLEPKMRGSQPGRFYEAGLGFVGTIGRHSLAAYVLHVILLYIFDLVVGLPATSAAGFVMAMVSVVVAYAWALRPALPRIRVPRSLIEPWRWST